MKVTNKQRVCMACEKTVYAQGKCKGHYQLSLKGKFIDTLLVQYCECGEVATERSDLCLMHKRRRYGISWYNANKERAKEQARKYQRSGKRELGGPVVPQKEVVGYFQAHRRVKYAKGGPASSFDCVTCGLPAKHWALKHDAVETHWELVRGKYLCEYSLIADDYEPKCVKDHLNGDRDNRVLMDCE